MPEETVWIITDKNGKQVYGSNDLERVQRELTQLRSSYVGPWFMWDSETHKNALQLNEKERELLTSILVEVKVTVSPAYSPEEKRIAGRILERMTS